MSNIGKLIVLESVPAKSYLSCEECALFGHPAECEKHKDESKSDPLYCGDKHIWKIRAVSQ